MAQYSRAQKKIIKERVFNERKNYLPNGRKKMMSQQEFAKAVSMAKMTYSNVENACQDSSLNTVNFKKIADVVGCDYEYLDGTIDCRTKVADEIQKKTGLEEESIDLLIKIKADSPHKTEEDEIFFSLLTKIIKDYYEGHSPTLFEKSLFFTGTVGDGEFPIMKLVSYISDYKYFVSLVEGFKDDSNKEQLLDMNLKKRELDRFYLEKSFSKFLESEFMEGVSNGK